MLNCLKRIRLKIRKIRINLWHNIVLYIGRICMVFCVIIFLMIICTNIMHRAPIFEYFIEELCLPLTLKYSGCISIYDEENRIEPIPVMIKIGGYQKSFYNGEEIELVFSATDTKNIPIIIEYQSKNKVVTKLEYISYQGKQDSIECSFTYYE